MPEPGLLRAKMTSVSEDIIKQLRTRYKSLFTHSGKGAVRCILSIERGSATLLRAAGCCSPSHGADSHSSRFEYCEIIDSLNLLNDRTLDISHTHC